MHPNAYPYQSVGANWLAQRQNACLFDDMGVGKTAQAIWACDVAGIRKILVICPGIARVNWQREFLRWQTVERTVGIIADTKSVPDTEVVVASYNGICARAVLVQLLARRWDKIIYDESHYLKNRNALRTKVAFGSKCDGTKGLAACTDGTWLLSGTPFPNGPHEAWTFTRALFPDAVASLEKYDDWERYFCITAPSTFGTRVIASTHLAEFRERLRPYILRRLLRDVQPDLPPARFGHVVVSAEMLPENNGAEYAEIEAVISAAISKSGGTIDETALQWVSAVQLSTLRRLTGIAKAPAVAQLLQEELSNGLQKIVVFAVHREVIDILANKIPDARIIDGRTPPKKRQPIIDAFQGRVTHDNPRVLICNIDVASTALTLTSAADVAFAETTWVPKDVLQGVQRCWRLGQTRPVLARIFSLAGSLDEVVGATLARKGNLVSALEWQFSQPRIASHGTAY